jgi:hypothetical protein
MSVLRLVQLRGHLADSIGFSSFKIRVHQFSTKKGGLITKKYKDKFEQNL